MESKSGGGNRLNQVHMEGLPLNRRIYIVITAGDDDDDDDKTMTLVVPSLLLPFTLLTRIFPRFSYRILFL